jgi:hypothetical protein
MLPQAPGTRSRHNLFTTQYRRRLEMCISAMLLPAGSDVPTPVLVFLASPWMRSLADMHVSFAFLELVFNWC